MDGIRLETERLLLRRFAEDDAVALWRMCADECVTRYLLFDELKSLEGARGLLEEKFLAPYRRADAGEAGAGGFPLDARWAICEKECGEPIGFIQIGDNEAHEAGYMLRRASWRHGYAREALAAVISWARAADYPFLTAAHDVDNPRSGEVMRACGMTYRYTYREQWLPKKPLVDFRLYQIDLAPGVQTYRGYWEQHPDHWIEEGL